MLNKNDPLIGAVQEVMKKNHAEREAAKLVNEKFGVTDRKALPHEKQGAWDAAYKQVLSEGLHPNQKPLDQNKNNKLDSQDFKMLRAKKKPMEEENAPKTDPYAEGQASSISTVPAPKKEVTPADQSALKKKIQSIKEEEQIDEKAPPGAKYERMVKHIKSKLSKGGLTKKEKSIAYATAWKAKKKSDVNEGFNDRHSSSVTASAEKQAVAVQLNELGGLPEVVRKKQQQAKKDAITTSQRLAREPKEAPSSIGTKIKQGVDATGAGIAGYVNQALAGKEIAAAGDYAVKNFIGKPLGLSKGTTWDKEYGQEQEKEARAKLNHPTAYGLGAAAGNISNVVSAAGLVKGGLKYGAKKFIKSKADDLAKSAAAETTAATKPTSTFTPTPKPNKTYANAADELSPAAKERMSKYLDKRMGSGSSTTAAKPATTAAREADAVKPAATTATVKPQTSIEKALADGNAARAAREADAAKSATTAVKPAKAKPVSQVAKEPEIIPPKKPAASGGGIRGTFQDRLASARKNAGSDLKARQLPALRRTTEPAVRNGPSLPAVRPASGSNLPARTGMPNLAAGGGSRIVGLSNKGKAVVGGAALAAAGAGAYIASRSGNNTPTAAAKTTKDQSRVPETPSKDQSRVPQSSSAPAPAATSPVPTAPTAKAPTNQAPAKAKPVVPAANPNKPAPVQAVRKPQDSSTPAQRAQFNRQIDRGNAAPGTAYKGLGVSSGTTIQQKAAPQVKRPVGTGREK